MFLLVIQIGRFTQKEKEVFRQIKLAMGSHALSFSVVVFTHGDLLEEGKPVKHCLIDDCMDLAQLVDRCGGRYCVFNNHSFMHKKQVSELLALVEDVLQGNGGTCYSIRMMQIAEKDLAWELKDKRRLEDEKEELLKKKLEAAIKEMYEKDIEMLRQKSNGEMEQMKKNHELGKEKLGNDHAEDFRRGIEENDRKEKERRLQEMLRMMAMLREEEERRDALQKKLDKVTQMLEEQAEREEQLRGAMEKKIKLQSVEYEKKERERELQQIQREQAIRQHREMKRNSLQKELEKLSQRLEEQSKKEQERQKHMEGLLRRQMEENQRERDIQMEHQRAEKRRMLALQQELKLVRMKTEQQKTSEANLRRQLEENLWREKGSCDREMPLLKAQHSKKCSELCNEMTTKRSAEKQSTVKTVTGYTQEMGLLGLNVALEKVGAPCCIQ